MSNKIYAKLTLSDSNYTICNCGECGAQLSISGITPSNKYCPNCGVKIIIPSIVASHIKELQERYQKGYDKGKANRLESDIKEEVKKNLTKKAIKEYILEVIDDYIGDDTDFEEILESVSSKSKMKIILNTLKGMIKS